MSPSQSTPDHGRAGLGPALRRAWIGYQQQVDEAMDAAGFGERGFPDGRVLRMVRDEPPITTSDIGRALGITRQGAGKIVTSLRERGYVTVETSPTNGREKSLTVTQRALEYLAAQRKATRRIEQRVDAELGLEAVSALHRLVEYLGANEDPRLRGYLRKMGVREI